MKIYKVTLKNSAAFYVIASDTNDAYNKLRTKIDEEDWYFTSERELKSIEVIANPFVDSDIIFVKE